MPVQREVALIAIVPHLSCRGSTQDFVIVDQVLIAVEGRAVGNVRVVAIPVELAVAQLIPVEEVLLHLVSLPIIIAPVIKNLHVSDTVIIGQVQLQLLLGDAGIIVQVEVVPPEIELVIHAADLFSERSNAIQHLL